MNKPLEKHLNKPGEYDYDIRNDIFFFKVKNREYSHSVELRNFVIDFDDENFIVGLQIFDASDFLNIPKEILLQVKGFGMKAQVKDGVIQINLGFTSVQRNKTTQHSPIIVQEVGQNVPDTKVISSLA